MALMSGSELIEAFRGRIAVTGCTTELATYQRVRAAAQTKPRLEQSASDFDPTSRMEASEMQKLWWKWWRGSEKTETLFLTFGFPDTPSALVAECITNLIEKHVVLSSRFVESEDRLSVYLNDVSTFRVDDLSEFNSVAEAFQAYEDWKKPSIRHEDEWLVRAAVATVRNDTVAALEVSHLICDGHSLTVLGEDLRRMLAQYKAGATRKPERDFGFFDYVIAERKWSHSDGIVELRRYWAERVESAPILSTPGGTPVGGRISGPRTRFQIHLPSALVQQIAALGRKMKTTPYAIFLSFYALALSDWAKCRKFYISSVYDLRSTPERLATVGYLTCTRLTEISFKNTLDVREAINHVWLQEQFSRSVPLPPGAGDDPPIRNGVSALLNYVPTNRTPSELPSERISRVPCTIGEPMATGPRPAGHPISLVLRDMPNGEIQGALDFGGDHISVGDMRSLANAFKDRLESAWAILQEP